MSDKRVVDTFVSIIFVLTIDTHMNARRDLFVLVGDWCYLKTQIM